VGAVKGQLGPEPGAVVQVRMAMSALVVVVAVGATVGGLIGLILATLIGKLLGMVDFGS
jgi:hypothetical protein